jgi:plastocyanin
MAHLLAHLRSRALRVAVGALLGAVLVIGGAAPALADGAAAGYGAASGGAYGVSAASGMSEMSGYSGIGVMARGAGYRPTGYSPTGSYAPATRVAYVSIANFAFHPATTRIRAGTTVVWTNYDPVPHTVSFANGRADSSILYPGQSFALTIWALGTFGYHCRIHPFMHGWVRVTR